jgi:ubiquinone/menaquinone biosynthesis C-methylase UbiE
MNRSITNIIRFCMDELIPPIIRDSRWFMYPFFYYAFKGYKKTDLALYMDFKARAYDMTEKEFSGVYQKLESLGGDRPTDMNEGCMRYALDNYDKSAKTILDVGCGRGFWADRVYDETNLKVTGVDVLDNVPLKGKYVQGSMEKLPFKDGAFDIVFSSHTIEHMRDLPTAIAELKRVAKKQVIIVTPCQRYYYYTLDLHLNFFPLESYMQRAVNDPKAICKKISGDWVVVINK